jgi:DMSO/TMAO reductase YedYZ molybdopterin-dependent catalytic subunit
MTDESDLPPDTKLTTTKQRWARERRFITGRVARAESDRLPPGQHVVKDWPVLDLGLQPEIRPGGWTLDIGGLVENPQHWNLQAFMAQPQVEMVSDIHCVTSWSRYDNGWTGVATLDLLDLVRPLPAAHHVVLHSYDGYTTNVTLQDFAGEDVLLAHSWQGRPLPAEHGGPVRLVLPRLYFWKSAKWVNRIEFTAEDRPGFWEVRGYHNRGDPWAEERYSDD